MRIWLLARWARIRGERGAAYAEYTPLLAVIALLVIFGLAFLGPRVAEQLGVLGLSIGYGDYVAGECPSGDWSLIKEGDADPKKNSQLVNVNVNGDDYVCEKSGMGGGNGNGNTNQNSNVKDNNSYPWDP